MFKIKKKRHLHLILKKQKNSVQALYNNRHKRSLKKFCLTFNVERDRFNAEDDRSAYATERALGFSCCPEKQRQRSAPSRRLCSPLAGRCSWTKCTD